MSEFDSPAWEWFIFITVVLSLIGLIWLLSWVAKCGPNDAASTSDSAAEVKTTGHSWDGLEELNNPLPRWWLWLFYISIAFAVVYLILYPGSGIYQGALKWTSSKSYEQEMKQVNARLKPLYDSFLKRPIPVLATDVSAMKTGARVFYNNCMACHGSDAGGSKGFPNLKDKDWLYGSSPNVILASIAGGRNGIMPAWGAALPGDQLDNVTEYVISLSKRKHNAEKAKLGKVKFNQFCIACHGNEGRGKQIMGAANLTDNVWLHGGSRGLIKDVIKNGRNSVMPAHEGLLSKAKIHLLAAYIYSLSLIEKNKNN